MRASSSKIVFLEENLGELWVPFLILWQSDWGIKFTSKLLHYSLAVCRSIMDTTEPAVIVVISGHIYQQPILRPCCRKASCGVISYDIMIHCQHAQPSQWHAQGCVATVQGQGSRAVGRNSLVSR